MKTYSKLVLVLVLSFLLAVLWTGCSGEETFRNAKVMTLAGSAQLMREKESMAVYEGLVLKGGDLLTTDSQSQLVLKLDEDKYVVLEENTRVTLELEGDPQKGAIRLYQTSGTIHHTIENPLSPSDSYQVHTPDAVMAVRGTDFTTIVKTTDQGTQTETQVQEGTVEMTPRDSQEPSRLLGPGEGATAGTKGEEGAHFLIFCFQCSQEVDSEQAHLLSCGKDHYSCDGKNHDKLACGHLACEGGDHLSLLPCGEHFACTGGDHETKMSCGHYGCAEGDHDVLLECEHYACQDGSHERLSCYYHFACTPDHQEGVYGCGHRICLGGDHAKLDCGHRACAEGSHDLLACTHFACTGGNHSKLSCGSYACQGGHSALACGHCACDDTYEDHSQMSCGHYACSQEDLGHQQLSCGNYDCQGGGHGSCYGCGACVCTGDHSQRPCSHLACQEGAHEGLDCGHYRCSAGTHELLGCGHYSCDGGIHDTYLPCGNLICTQGHEQLPCGHCSCDPQDHGQMACGHYTCDSAAAGDHVQQSCGSYDCQGDHSPCPWCAQCICTGSHGEGSCNAG